MALRVLALCASGFAWAQEPGTYPKGEREGRLTRVLVLADPEGIAFNLAAAKALGAEKTGELAVAPPAAPEASKMGLALSGVSMREVAHFHLGLSIFMGIGLAVGGQERELRNVMEGMVQVLDNLDLGEDIVAKARAIAKKGTASGPEDFQALAAAVNGAIRNPRESMAYGIGLASGTLVLAMSASDSSMVKQAHDFLKQLTEAASEMGIENPIVALGRDLMLLAAQDPVRETAVQAAFEKRLKEMGLSSPQVR